MPARKVSATRATAALVLAVLALASTTAAKPERHPGPSPTAAESQQRPRWAVVRHRPEERSFDGSPAEARNERRASDFSDLIDRRAGLPPVARTGRSGTSSASMFVRSTYNPSASSRRPIAFPESPRPSPTADPFLTTTITPPELNDDGFGARRKRVKLIRFIDNEGHVAKTQAQAVSPGVTNNDTVTRAPSPSDPPGLEESGGEASGRQSSSNSLLDIGKPGNPYELIQVAFPPNSRIRPKPVTTNELVDNDLTEFDPSEVYFTDGNLLVLKGGSFPKNYRPADPGPPIDNYQAPYREPKLPPAGLEIGGLPPESEPPEFYPENPPPGKDLFGNPIDPLAQPNATEYNLCPIEGPCQPLLFPPIVGEHPPPDGVAPIVLLHPNVKVSTLREKPEKSVYPSDADRYTYYAVNYGRPKIVPAHDALGNVDEVLKNILQGFFPPVDTALPESIGQPVLSNVPKVPITPVPKLPSVTPRPPLVTAFPPRPPRPTKPPKKILFPGDEIFQFPELNTRRPQKFPPASKPIHFRDPEKTRPKTKFELYQQLLKEQESGAKVSPWVPRVSRRPDGSLRIQPDPPRGGPNPEFTDNFSSGFHHTGHFRRPQSAFDTYDQQFRLQPAFSEDFGTTYFPSTTTPAPVRGVSLEHDTDVNFKLPRPPVNPQSENYRPRFREPLSTTYVATTPSPFRPAFVSFPQNSPFSASNIAAYTAVTAFPTLSPSAVIQQTALERQRRLLQEQQLLALQQEQLRQQSAPAFVRYLFQLGPPNSRPLIQYTQYLGKRKK